MGFLSSLKSAADSIVVKAKAFAGNNPSKAPGGGPQRSNLNVDKPNVTFKPPFAGFLPSPALNVAGTTPMILKPGNAQQPCLICEFLADVAVESSQDAAEFVAENFSPLKAVKVYKNVRPYVTAKTAQDVAKTAFKEKIGVTLGSNFLKGSFTALAFWDAGKEALNLRKVAERGLVKETAASASKVIGLATSATVSIAMGGLATMALVAFAPATPVLLGFVIVAALGVGAAKLTEMAWNKFGQEKMTNKFENYIKGADLF